MGQVRASLLVVLFLLEIYRAATQSFTVDEAHIYLAFVRPGFRAMLSGYDAGHHVLYTYLEWMTSLVLGSSELVLRLPALGACAAYFWFVHRVTSRLPGRVLQIGAALVLAANPLLLDHLAIARGYGLALAFFVWSLEAARANRLTRCAVLAALSIAANLTFAFPVAALMLVMLVRNPAWQRLNDFVGPALIVAFVLLIVPLSHAGVRNFYFGVDSFTDSARDTVVAMFDRRFPALGFATGCVLLGGGAVASFALLRRDRLTAPVTILAAVFLVAAHLFLKMALPQGRTGLWLVFLLALCLIEAAAELPSKAIAAALCLILGIAQSAQFDPRFYGEWKYNSHAKRLMKKLRDAQAANARPYSITGPEHLQWLVDYYRLRLRMRNLEPFRVKRAAGYAIVFASDAAAMPGYARFITEPGSDLEIRRSQ